MYAENVTVPPANVAGKAFSADVAGPFETDPDVVKREP